MTVTKERLGMLFALVGPGGVGKNTLLKLAAERLPNLAQLPTATTRPMRPEEQQGKQHDFVSLEVFEQMVANDELVEHQEVHPGEFYGVPRVTVEKAIAERRDQIADIDILGAAAIRTQYPQHSVAIFIAPPSVAALRERMEERGTSAKDIQNRLNRMPMEMQFMPTCRYVIVNDDLDVAADELCAIIRLERGELNDFTPRYAVSFQVAVQHNELLTANLSNGDEPEMVALHLVNDASPQRLKCDGDKPVVWHYDCDKRTYDVTYRFVYNA